MLNVNLKLNAKNIRLSGCKENEIAGVLVFVTELEGNDSGWERP